MQKQLVINSSTSHPSFQTSSAQGDAATCAARVQDQFAQGADGVILHAATPKQLAPVLTEYSKVRDNDRFAGRSNNPGL